MEDLRLVITLAHIIKEDNNAYIFEDDFDLFLLSESFSTRYGKYIPFSYKFRLIDDKIFLPPLKEDFFNNVSSITYDDMMKKNYTALDICIRKNIIFVLDGHHRILKLLQLCLENKTSLSDIKLNYNLVEEFND